MERGVRRDRGEYEYRLVRGKESISMRRKFAGGGTALLRAALGALVVTGLR